MTTETDILNRHFPELAYSEMDGALYWKSVEEHQPGTTITHDGRDYVVLSSWPWWRLGDVQVFMAELKPV